MDLHSRLLGTDSNIFCAMSLSAKIAYVILPIVHQAHSHCHGNPACPKKVRNPRKMSHSHTQF